MGPAGRAGGSPEARVEDEEREDAVLGAGLDQRRVVGQPQVAPEPHHRGHRRHAIGECETPTRDAEAHE